MKRTIIFMLVLVLCIQFENCSSSTHEFHIDFNRNTFIRDGEPFRYISGSIHPYRIPRSLWQDRLNKMWAAGLSAIEVYVFWNEHEQSPGFYDFEGKNDIYAFIKMAQNVGLAVILRIGPYACAEHEYGGFPWWFLSDRLNPIVGRSSDPKFLKVVQRYYNVLLPPLVPLLYNNGGPIIMVQIENEYGGFACDTNYLIQLRDIVRSYLGDDVVYFTTDNSVDYCVKCGKIPGAYSTVDFGPWDNLTHAFIIQRTVSPNGPLVNSEYYTGWIDTWGTNHTRTAIKPIVDLFNVAMDMGANLNFYMFHGGTNFGFSSGAVHPYVPVITSYDYDAPISEAGDITPKYLALREAISKYSPLPPGPIPSNSSKKLMCTTVLDLIIKNAEKCVSSKYPMTFEELGQGHGFILYSTTLNATDLFGKVLNLSNIGDRAYVQLGSQPIGIIQRNTNNTLITINLKDIQDSTLNIIVENMGRLNVEPLDPKGLLSNVTLDGQILQYWTACLTDNFIPYFQENVNTSWGYSHFLNNIKDEMKKPNKYKDFNSNAPAVYAGMWNPGKNVSETFLKIDQFSKGIALITSQNSVTNLGRYWSSVGPQHTLYVPTEFVTESYLNIIILIEFENVICNDPDSCYVELIDYPILD